MELLIFLFILLMPFIFIHSCIQVIKQILYKNKISQLVEKIDNKQDFIFLCFKDFMSVIIEIFKRKGYQVEITPHCGEEENGLFLNRRQFAECWKHGLNEIVDVETARKLKRCMQLNSICRGMLITLGDFRQSTKLFCHTNVIECINGDQLVQMCKEVRRKGALEPGTLHYKH